MKGMRRGAAIFAAACAVLAVMAAGASAKVLRVGTYHGVKGQYKTIQAAVNAAKSGDWILVAPGDYKTHSSTKLTVPSGAVPAGIMIKKSNIFIRGMNRNTVIVDGTKGGAPCNGQTKYQNFGPNKEGLNGIEVYEGDNDWVQNLTACNFLGGSGDTGNEIWWDGRAGGGKIHGKGFVGSYLNATSYYYKNENTAARYGMFSSDWSGGLFDHDYSSDFNDSGYYIGGCSSQCDQVMKNSQAEYNALGYSGTNSGGSMLFEYNKFDHNQDGFDTNSQNNDDWPSPQDGTCPKGVKPLIKGAKSCWIVYHNQFYDNNNPNVPKQGAAAAGPVGTGISIEGTHDTIMDNTFTNDGAWGIALQPYPDTETPPADVVKAGMACHGGTPNFDLFGITIPCLYEDQGEAVLNNKFTHVGYYGNPSNGDFEMTTEQPNLAASCFVGNTDARGHLYTVAGSDVTTSKQLQATDGKCGGVAATPTTNTGFLLEVACDSEGLGFSGGTPVGCTPTDKYPRSNKVVIHKLPTKHLSTMKNPCGGVPKNPWCPAKKA